MQKNGFDKSFKPDPNKLTIVMNYIRFSDGDSVPLRVGTLALVILGW